VIREFQVSPLVLLTSVLVLAAGELASGTGLYFVAMMAVAMISIGVTFNLLGGLRTFSGIIFTGFALRTIVISQFAKVLLYERADKNLEVPQLTISIYAVFFFSAMLGAFVFGNARLPLPKPWEPKTYGHAQRIYAVSCSVGLVAMIVWESYFNAFGTENRFDETRSAAQAFSPLLLFALVLAVNLQIKRTNGRHSFGWGVFVPWFVTMGFGLIDSVRTSILAPSIIYFATCYVNGYQFRKRHYIAAVSGIALFFMFVSPLEIYTRNFTRDLSLRERAQMALFVVSSFHSLSELNSAVLGRFEESSSANREGYYNNAALYTLSRLSEIRADSNLIASCANGSRYGLTAVKIDFSRMIPSFIDPKKERVGGENYLGHVAGTISDEDPITQIEFSAVADSYGGFGWWGVVLFPLFGFPLVYIINESMFGDISQPWSTVALGTSFLLFGGMNMGRLAQLVLRDPIFILLLSYLVVGITKMVYTKGSKRFLIDPEQNVES